MKNLHVLPTNKYSDLVHSTNKYGGYFLSKYYSPMKEMGDSYQNIYITSNEEIKEGDWMIRDNENPIKVTKDFFWDFGVRYYKIVLTDNEDLIKDGVQAIEDKFLEWFVKNPSCEEVEVEPFHGIKTSVAEINAVSGDGSLKWRGRSDLRDYKIIISKEENDYTALLRPVGTNQETLEEFIEKTIDESFEIELASSKIEKYINLAVKWQQERMYSEEDVVFAYEQGARLALISQSDLALVKGKFPTPKEWFETFKNK